MANTSKSSNNTILIALIAVGIVVLVGGWWWRKKQEEENALADALPTKEPITCKNRGDGVYSCTGDFSSYDTDCLNDFGACLKTRYPAAKYFLANGIRLEGNVPVQVDVTTRPGAGATPTANNAANTNAGSGKHTWLNGGTAAPPPTNNGGGIGTSILDLLNLSPDNNDFSDAIWNVLH